MNKQELIDISLALYKVTAVLPRKEPLRNSLRKRANGILEDGILLFADNPIVLDKKQKSKIRKNILNHLEIILGFFKIARKQGWVDEINFDVLEREYGKILRAAQDKVVEDDFRSPGHYPQAKQEKQAVNSNNSVSANDYGHKVDSRKLKLPNARCERIMKVMREKGSVQVQNLKEVFPGLSKRTLRRDFDKLVRMRLVRRTGEGKGTFYELNRTAIS